MKKTLAAFGLVLSLAACADTLPPPAPVAKTLPPKIGMDVQVVTLADRTEIQTNSPYNGNHFNPTINEAIRQWATDRLQATGQTGQAIVLIKDASLTAQVLAKQDGIDTWFTRQQAVKYTGHADVSIEANGRPGFATADANATRSVTLPEDPTDMEKQDAYYKLLTGLMKDLNTNLDSAIQTHMASFITSAPVDDKPAPALTVTDKPVMPAASALPPATLPPAPPTPAPVAPPVSVGRTVIPLSGAQ